MHRPPPALQRPLSHRRPPSRRSREPRFRERGLRMTERPAFVLLEDGSWFPGTVRLPLEPSFGEVVFTTNLSGYQETFTDPSYLGQIVVMTAPMIGNYGINTTDLESERPQVSGVVVRELSRTASSWRATGSLGDWLEGAGVPLIDGVDTRRLTRHIRSRGAMRGVLAEGPEPTEELTARLMASPSMEGKSPSGSRPSTSAGVVSQGTTVTRHPAAENIRTMFRFMPKSMATMCVPPFPSLQGSRTDALEARSSPSIEGEAIRRAVNSSVGSGPSASTPRIAPRERICLVSRRVSTPSMSGTPAPSSQSPRLPVARQLDAVRDSSRTTTPLT